jgi:hypothetical protein
MFIAGLSQTLAPRATEEKAGEEMACIAAGLRKRHL